MYFPANKSQFELAIFHVINSHMCPLGTVLYSTALEHSWLLKIYLFWELDKITCLLTDVSTRLERRLKFNTWVESLTHEMETMKHLSSQKKKKGKALKIRKKIIYTLSVEEFWFPFHISYLIMMKSKYILLFISVKSRPSQRPPASCKVKSEMFAARAGPALVGTRLNINMRRTIYKFSNCYRIWEKLESRG